MLQLLRRIRQLRMLQHQTSCMPAKLAHQALPCTLGAVPSASDGAVLGRGAALHAGTPGGAAHAAGRVYHRGGCAGAAALGAGGRQQPEVGVHQGESKTSFIWRFSLWFTRGCRGPDTIAPLKIFTSSRTKQGPAINLMSEVDISFLPGVSTLLKSASTVDTPRRRTSCCCSGCCCCSSPASTATCSRRRPACCPTCTACWASRPPSWQRARQSPQVP